MFFKNENGLACPREYTNKSFTYQRNLMKILLHDYSGHPLEAQLSRALANRGHEVLHLYSASFQTPHGLLERRGGDPNNLIFEGICLKAEFKKYSFYKRRKQEKEYGGLLAKRVQEFNPKIVISANTPLDPQKILLKTCRRNGIKFIFWLQDVYGVAIEQTLRKRIPLIGTLIGRYYTSLEKKLLNQSDKIIAISDDFKNLLHQWGLAIETIEVIQNWGPVDDIPLLPKSNPWSKEHGLADKINLLYSGTLGLKHNPELLLKLALFFKDHKNVRIVVISEGLGAEWLLQKKNELGLHHLMIMRYQPFEVLPYTLASADILLAVLNSEAGIYSVPSKILAYLCAGKPLLAAIPKENLSARIISDFNSGIVVSPNDTIELTTKAKQLIEDEKLRFEMAKAGRAYAEKAFNISSITDRFEEIFKDIFDSKRPHFYQ